MRRWYSVRKIVQAISLKASYRYHCAIPAICVWKSVILLYTSIKKAGSFADKHITRMPWDWLDWGCWWGRRDPACFAFQSGGFGSSVSCLAVLSNLMQWLGHVYKKIEVLKGPERIKLLPLFCLHYSHTVHCVVWSGGSHWFPHQLSLKTNQAFAAGKAA